MGTYNLYIPSSTGAYTTGAGGIRLKIYYDGAGSGDTNFDSPAKFASKLHYDFSIGSNGEQSLSSVKLEFWNKSNIWETHGGSGVFAQATDKNRICLDIILEGSVFWSGVADYMNVEKDGYYDDAGTPKYTIIRIPFLDKTKMLETITLAEAGIASGDSVATIIGAIGIQLDLNTEMSYENFTFTEISGRVFGVRSAMPQNSLKVEISDTSENCLNMLKRLALGFGFQFYNYRGNLRIQDRDSSTFSALNASSNDYPIKFIPKKQPIQYVAVKGTKDWSVLEQGIGYDLDLPEDTRRFSVGAWGANESKNFVLDLTEALQDIYYSVYTTGNTYTPGDAITGFTAADPTDRPGEVKIINPALGVGYGDSGWEAESGMIAELNISSYVVGRFFSVVTHWETWANYFYMISNGKVAADIDIAKVCRIIRKKPSTWTTYDKLYKMYPCLKTVCAIYAKALMGDKSMNVKQKTFRHVYLGFSYASENYMIVRMDYDFDKGSCEYDADQITGTQTVASSNDVAQHVMTVDAVDDGTNKVTASAIYNHINDKTIHIRHSYGGVSFLKMHDENGNDWNVWIKIVNGRRLLAIEPTEPD